jgi:hypothetical protein
MLERSIWRSRRWLNEIGIGPDEAIVNAPEGSRRGNERRFVAMRATANRPDILGIIISQTSENSFTKQYSGTSDCEADTPTSFVVRTPANGIAFVARVFANGCGNPIIIAETQKRMQ